MLESGNYYELTVSRISSNGIYLVDEEQNEVLLPNRYVSLQDSIGDVKRVFVHHDSEDRLIATTMAPYAVVGEVACMKVVDKTVHGAFLDWGIEAKDLFLPNRNMLGGVQPGNYYPVYVYRDDRTGRAVATMHLRNFIANDALDLERGQQVDVIVTSRTDRGYRVVLNNRHWGMLYDNQLFRQVSIGERTTGYVRKITEDNKVDISLQQEGFDEVKASAERLLALIRTAGGHLSLNDKSTPEEVVKVTGMSKKVFKRTAGYLMKRGNITMGDEGVKITEEQ